MRALFAAIAVLFIGIMIAVWIGAERANPVMLELPTESAEGGQAAEGHHAP